MQIDANGIKRSLLCRSFHQGGETVEVEIYQLAWSDGWTLELIHADGGGTIWLAEFATEQAALAEFIAQIAKTGLPNLIAGAPLHFPTMH